MKRIATRKSALALWQAAQAQAHLSSLGYTSDIVKTDTTGDRVQWTRLSNAELQGLPETSAHLATGKGLFIKEVQDLLLDESPARCHVAVHSMKDLPVTATPGLVLAGFLPAASPRDVLVAHPTLAGHIRSAGKTQPRDNTPVTPGQSPLATRAIETADLVAAFTSLWHQDTPHSDAPPVDAPRPGHLPRTWRGMPIGTTSLRRGAALRRLGLGDVPVTVLRGNVDTRLARLRAGEFAAILLAEAGLRRLGLFDDTHMFPLDERVFVPACTQGIVGLETPGDEHKLAREIFLASEAPTIVRAALERLVLHILGGDCHSIAGIHLSRALGGEQAAASGAQQAAGELLIFTARGDGTAAHLSALGASERLHNQTHRTLADWLDGAFATWQQARHFSDFFERCKNDTPFVSDLSQYLKNEQHIADMLIRA